MIAFPTLLVEPAKSAGISVPKDPDRYNTSECLRENPHFFALCMLQLGRPLPYPNSHWRNAESLAKIDEKKLKQMTLCELEAVFE